MKIKEIKLLTNQVEMMKDFYTNVLELPLIKYTDQSVTISLGTSLLSFLETKSIREPYYHFAFNISENKLNLAIGWLQQRGITINKIDGKEDYFSESWNSHSTYFYDPAGNIVEFIARHKLRTNSNTDFSHLDILNISEIGLPSENVKEISEYIQNHFNEQFYDSGDSMFAAIGDEEGLIIVSSLDRNWLGSNKKVEIFPINITISNEREGVDELLHYPYTITTE